MADICPKMTNALRTDLKNRYNLDIDARITRIEFENTAGVRTYFRADDSWTPPAQPEPVPEPAHEYKVVAFEKVHRTIDAQPKVAYNTTLAAAMAIYATYQRAGYALVELYEDNTLIQRCQT